VDEEQSNKNLELYRTEKIHLIKRLILELPKVTVTDYGNDGEGNAEDSYEMTTRLKLVCLQKN
jgi:hypothetical protein